VVDALLGVITAGVLAVLGSIKPVLVEFVGLIMIPVGDALQWIACRLQEGARLLWMAGRKLEVDGKLYRRSA